MSETPVRPELKATLRLGQRELSVLTALVILLILGALGFGIYRSAVSFKSRRDVVVTQTNMHALYLAMRSYSLDWDNRLPPADQWTDKVAGYLSSPPNTPGGPQAYLRGSGDDGPVGYVYNDVASNYLLEPNGEPSKGKRIDPADLVLLIERPNVGRNAHTPIPAQVNEQAMDDLLKSLTFPHYADDPKNAETVILFADQSVQTRIRQDFRQP